MIALASECLLLKLESGEMLPCSADMVFEELDRAVESNDSHFVQQACHAVFYYFKRELGREEVSIDEFREALEKALGLLSTSAAAPEVSPARGTLPPVVSVVDSPEKSSTREADLGALAAEAGSSCELFFYPRLREEVRRQLETAQGLVLFSGLRPCVKQLAGAQRWSGRCRTLRDQIVSYLRECVSEYPGEFPKALVVV